jgi:hypothetical protein
MTHTSQAASPPLPQIIASPPRFSLLIGFKTLLAMAWFIAFFGSASASAQDYKPALSLVPENAAGVVRIPHVPDFCEAWKSTTLAAMLDDPAMGPFMEAQRRLAAERSDTLGFNIGVKPREILEVASGEALLAWLPFDDQRRPYALALIADIRGRRDRVEVIAKKIDADFRALGATLKESTFGDERIRVYTLKPVPGQIKIEQVAITFNDERLIAADRDTLVVSLLEAVAGRQNQPKLPSAKDYAGIFQRVADAPAAPAENDQTQGHLEWFARPLRMGRIVKDAAKIDRGQQVDILNLLERQGFDAISAVGGRLTVGRADFDLLHKGFIWAPPAPGQSERFRLAARMLQAINVPDQPTPNWVSDTVASFSQLNWKLSESFWYAESLVNDAFGQQIFQDLLNDIRDDKAGPQIDIAKNVIPNLGEHVMIMTDNILPADQRSERVLFAIETTDAAALRDAVRRAMEVETDATLIASPVVGVDVYRVLRTDGPSDFDAELFEDLGLEAETDPNTQPPLLNEWAITVIDRPGPKTGGKAPGYLIFSSHPELLLDTLPRFGQMNAAGGFADHPDVKEVAAHLQRLGASERAYVRIARTDLTFRVKYELIRAGKLRDSDSVLASLFRRVFLSKDEEHKNLGTDQLPPFGKVEQYFRPAGGFSRATDAGWTLDGFLLK